jgi:hypothetical protein
MVGNVTRREGREMRIDVGWGHLNIRIRPEDLGVDWRTILKRFFKYSGRLWTGFVCCWIGTNDALM